MPPASAVTASLEDPRYYLANFRFVLGWVVDRHGDLLEAAEHGFVSGFAALPEESQALLVRMVMRKGEHFRTARLAYPEIGDTEAALAPLVEAGLVKDAPPLSLETLFHQLRLPELRRALAGEIQRSRSPARRAAPTRSPRGGGATEIQSTIPRGSISPVGSPTGGPRRRTASCASPSWRPATGCG